MKKKKWIKHRPKNRRYKKKFYYQRHKIGRKSKRNYGLSAKQKMVEEKIAENISLEAFQATKDFLNKKYNQAEKLNKFLKMTEGALQGEENEQSWKSPEQLREEYQMNAGRLVRVRGQIKEGIELRKKIAANIFEKKKNFGSTVIGKMIDTEQEGEGKDIFSDKSLRGPTSQNIQEAFNIAKKTGKKEDWEHFYKGLQMRRTYKNLLKEGLQRRVHTKDGDIKFPPRKETIERFRRVFEGNKKGT